MITVKRFGAIALTVSCIAGMLPTAALAADIAPETVQTITGFEQAGQEIGAVTFTLGQAEEELTAQMPQTVTAALADGTVADIPVTWVNRSDYSTTDDFYYEYIPQWDSNTYVLADNVAELPYVLAQRSEQAGSTDDEVRAQQSASNANADTIFAFFIKNMGYNAAAASGVLANIKAESNFNPNCYGDNNTSYGICQWHNERFTALKNWCDENGYSWTSLTGQLNYLKKELSANDSDYLWNGKTINNKMKTYANSADGAYDAGYYWCYYYEVPANKDSVAKSRGNQAKNTYWPEYGDKTISDHSSVSSIFTDISSSAWYKNSVQYVYDNGLMAGTSSNTFSPNSSLTRAQMAQILYNRAGKPAVSGTIPFKDVSKSAWYYHAVCWAYNKGYVSGYSSQKFGPENNVTHEQAVVIMHNYAGKPTSGKAVSFSDASSISSWAVNAVKWANYKGMLGYVSLEKTSCFYPQKACTRAEMAYILMEYFI
ncbi:MAG: phage tail tip lysozyme [Clostridiales bacterium]|nr:phage tail tip lysozyme [Clostridiales bacterium]